MFEKVLFHTIPREVLFRIVFAYFVDYHLNHSVANCPFYSFFVCKFSNLLSCVAFLQNLKAAVAVKILHMGWLAIAKLKPLSLFISLLLMLQKAFDNVEIEE